MSDTIRYIKQYIFPKTLKNNIKELLVHILPILNENNIRYWLVDGTLLGYYREKDIIFRDDDADIAILEDDFKKSMKILKNNLPKHFGDFNDNSEDEFNINNNRFNKLGGLGKIDLFIAYKENQNIKYENHTVPNDYIFPLKEDDFLGIKVKVPNKTDKILENTYGKDYMTPRSYYKGINYEGPQWQPPKLIQKAVSENSDKIPVLIIIYYIFIVVFLIFFLLFIYLRYNHSF